MNKPARMCNRAGCPGLVTEAAGVRTCSVCGVQGRRGRRTETPPPAWHGRLYGREWRERKARFLAKNALCVTCLAESGRTVAAYAVDHIVPHKGNEKLFWDETNWQPLCEFHHNQKTARGA
jgi:5-methylcytosine-specific restriction protein A